MAQTLMSAGSKDLFLVKFDQNGGHVWSNRFGDSMNQFGNGGVAIGPQETVVDFGIVTGDLTFGGATFDQQAGDSLYLARFSSMGSHVSSDAYISTGDRLPRDVFVDATGDAYLVGSFQNSVSFGGQTLTSAGPNSDVFVAKIDSVGLHLWSVAFGDNSPQIPNAATFSTSGDIYMCGRLGGGSINFGGGSLSGAPWLVGLDADSGHLFSSAVGGANHSSCDRLALGMNGLLLVGTADGQADFGGGPLPHAGANDIVVARLAP